ncbi:serine hydrolase [Winogradskyella flava]|uniref:serine hydrolase n=1 Tax=Winogradskyella flava TaxID=1884876 RepID=UPI002491D81C|nr:serine hydrolase [Winogradskyella flava]
MTFKKVLLFIIAIASLSNCKSEEAKNLENPINYKCLPCNLACDTIIFDKGGICPHCKMKLIPMSEKTSLIKLIEYEGKYEYDGESTISIIASKLDTTLYAIVDNAKYPLTYISNNTFTNMLDQVIVFQRDKNEEVISYKVSNEIFKLLTKDFERMEMLPRKKLFQHSEKYMYQQPEKLNDGLEVGNLNEVFKNDEPIIEMIRKTIDGDYPNVHSVLIYKNNKLVLEEYFYGHNKNIPHQLRSATKSFIGGIVGIAVDKGFIESEKDKLLPYFKSRYPEINNLNNRKKSLTIENFLMYRHGLDCEDSNRESKGNEMAMMESEDWVKYTLDLPMISEPGTSSSYCTGCALTLGSLVEITTKSNIEDFARKHLFLPLEISNYNWIFEPNKVSMTNFSQLKLTSRDLIKLAKMHKDGGKWKGKQIISENWINKTFGMEDGDYGYLWQEKYFEINGMIYSSYQASGNGGQKINIWPELDMITVFTGGNYNSYQLYGKSTPPNEMIPNYILKATE